MTCPLCFFATRGREVISYIFFLFTLSFVVKNIKTCLYSAPFTAIFVFLPTTMSRILAIDYGRKRTGIAVSDPMQMIANGLTTVATHQLMDFLLNYMQQEKVERIIIGHPKQMNNEDSENMKNIVPFMNRLKKLLPDMPVELVDERFTSVLAHQAMLMGGLKKKDRQNKALVDEISATIILQSYLESKRI